MYRNLYLFCPRSLRQNVKIHGGFTLGRADAEKTSHSVCQQAIGKPIPSLTSPRQEAPRERWSNRDMLMGVSLHCQSCSKKKTLTGISK